MVIDAYQSRSVPAHSSESGIWRSQSFTDASGHRSRVDYLSNLKLKFEGMNLPDESILPHLHRKAEKNQNFNLNFAVKLKEIERDPTQKRESIRQVAISIDELTRVARKEAIKIHGKPVKTANPVKLVKTDKQISERECANIIERFLDKLSLFERSANPNTLKSLSKIAKNLVVILQISTRDIMKVQRNELETEHLSNLINSFQNLKPLLACAFYNTDEFSAVYYELLRSKTHSDITNHLRRAAFAVLNALIDARERHEVLVLKAT